MSESMVCCPLSNGDADPAQFYDQSMVVAGRTLKCTECGCAITKGLRHELVKAKWDGHWSSFRTCPMCVEIRDHFACGEGYIFGEVWEQLETNFFPDMKAGGQCMQGLSPEAKRRLIDARMEWYFGQDEIDDSVWEDWKTRKPQ